MAKKKVSGKLITIMVSLKVKRFIEILKDMVNGFLMDKMVD